MASDEAKVGSVFDFLYADTRRLSSLLSQFSPDGIVTELVRSAEDASTLSAGLSIKVLKGDTSEASKEATSRKIDPKWLLPLLFLDEAQDRIQRDLNDASIGQLVLCQGKLVITDLRMLQRMWGNASLKKHIIQQIKDEAKQPDEGATRNDRRRAAKAKTDTSDAELALELLPLMPHSVQINVITQSDTVWATIEPEWLIGTTEDLMLKHGSKVAGSWSVVGILDGVPWQERDDEDYDEMLSLDERIRIGMGYDNVWKLATELAFPVRGMLGRPYMSYAMTPLMIFREIER